MIVREQRPHLSRRGFITGLGLFLAAPAIVRASSLMPVRNPRLPKTWFVNENYGLADFEWRTFGDVPPPNGQSWSTPFGRLSDALAVMRRGDSLYVRDTFIETPINVQGAKEVILENCKIPVLLIDALENKRTK